MELLIFLAVVIVFSIANGENLQKFCQRLIGMSVIYLAIKFIASGGLL